MYRSDFPPVLESVEELEAWLARERDSRLQLRLRLLLLIRSGEVGTRRQAYQRLGVHRNSVTRWLTLYEQGGLAALLRMGARPEEKPPSPPSLSREDEA